MKLPDLPDPKSTPKSRYKERRDWLCEQLDTDSVAILVGNRCQVRNKNINFRFRQDHDFYYYTGFIEPDSVAVIRPGHIHPFALFVLPKDEEAETWFAARTGIKAALETFGADLAFSIDELDTQLPQLFETRENIYLVDELGRFEDKIFDWLQFQRRSVKFDDFKCYPSLHSLLPICQRPRPIKDADEVELIRQAVKASVVGHKRLMQLCRPGLFEHQLASAFDAAISELGCQETGYPSIVAGGQNACCLHYDVNKDRLMDGDLLLVDAGGEYQYYTADITRTYPVNGEFSAEQASLYRAVLDALDGAIGIVKPGLPWNALYETAMEILVGGLVRLGILDGEVKNILATGAHKSITLHKTGHFLGLDVHDVGDYKDESGTWRRLEANMIFTLEPGVYIPNGMAGVDPKWHGLGVRIEDDILVTQTGYENLSADLPRTVREIEDWMAAT